jgi:hypothetical protein
MEQAPLEGIAPNICSSCGLVQLKGKEHADCRQCIVALQRSAVLLMEKIGRPGICRGCRATIYFVQVSVETGGGDRLKPAAKPYDANGQSHFMSCPQARNFYK